MLFLNTSQLEKCMNLGRKLSKCCVKTFIIRPLVSHEPLQKEGYTGEQMGQDLHCQAKVYLMSKHYGTPQKVHPNVTHI